LYSPQQKGKANNFNHPAIEELYTAFFYGNPDSVGQLFLDEMAEDNGHIALALTVAAV
jgi:hypothetical protein